jgi:hypothetical protein
VDATLELVGDEVLNVAAVDLVLRRADRSGKDATNDNQLRV